MPKKLAPLDLKNIKRIHSSKYYNTGAYTSWGAMRARCNNPNSKDYPEYGGRGIKICERWSRFLNFLDDMGQRPEGTSIDRIDNNGDYEPSNCRWATPQQQADNKRGLVFITYQGKTKSMKEWAKLLGLDWQYLRYRKYALKKEGADILNVKKRGNVK